MYYKYPRTPHLPWSLGITNEDRVLKDIKHFEGQEVVVTVKMDGENTSFYRNYIHARSLDYSNHSSRTWIKKLHSQIFYKIPDKYRICGENLYAKHSIYYEDLESYFLVFNIWNENECLSWINTKGWCQLLDLKIVPILYEGIWDENKIKDLWKSYFSEDKIEGYVIRLSNSFKYEDFDKSVAKFVRKNHVQTDDHWMNQKLIVNKLKDGD